MKDVFVADPEAQNPQASGPVADLRKASCCGRFPCDMVHSNSSRYKNHAPGTLTYLPGTVPPSVRFEL